MRHRVHDVSDDISEQVITPVRATKYGLAIQFDELTAVTNCSQLLVYVRFTENDAVKTELLSNEAVSRATNGKDIYTSWNEFFKKNGLEWSTLVGWKTDRGSARLGRKSRFQSCVKTVLPEISFFAISFYQRSQILILCQGVTSRTTFMLIANRQDC